jgi:hypothetical protein
MRGDTGLRLASLTHANEFLAARAAGVTVVTRHPEMREGFDRVGELLTELLKQTALLVCGVLISSGFLAEIHASGVCFCVLGAGPPVPLGVGDCPAGEPSQLAGVGCCRLVWSEGLCRGGVTAPSSSGPALHGVMGSFIYSPL